MAGQFVLMPKDCQKRADTYLKKKAKERRNLCHPRGLVFETDKLIGVRWGKTPSHKTSFRWRL